MISFRYHVVSLVAVFSAMAIGVLIGTNVISDQLIEGLQSQRNRDRAQLEAERAKTGALEAELSVWERVAKTTYDQAMRGKLAGRSVVLLVAKGESGNLTDGVVEGLELAGATEAGRIEFSADKMDPADRDPVELAEALGGEAGRLSKDAVLERAAQALAARLRESAEPRATDLLEVLDRAGLIQFSQSADGVFPPRSAAFVYVVSGGGTVRPRAEAFGLPLVRALSTSSLVAVAEPLNALEPLTERITADVAARARVLTVDHVDTAPGIYSLVVGLSDVIAGKRAEHYGILKRTSGVVPKA